MNLDFSIIMMSYNYARFIRQAIDSVLAQTSDSWELIIVDDCSSDDSWSIISEYSDKRILSFRHDVNQGASAAYNLALSKASGAYIACLDSDDVYLPDKLKRQAAYLTNNPDVGICGTFVTVIDDADVVVADGSRYIDWFNAEIDLNSIDNWRWENHLCHSSVVVRSELHKKVGNFNEKLVYTPDWQFWIRSAILGARFGVMPEPLVAYRSHGNNVTHKNDAAVVREHAQTCVDFLLPKLLEIRRTDLLDATLDGFICHPEVVASPELLNYLANIFRTAKDGASYVTSIGRLASKQAAELAQFRLHYAQDRGDEESDAHELAAIRPLLTNALDAERNSASQLATAQLQLNQAQDDSQKLQAQLDELTLSLAHSQKNVERQDKKIAASQIALAVLRKAEGDLTTALTELHEQLDRTRQAEEIKTKNFTSVLAATQSQLDSATTSTEELSIQLAAIKVQLDSAAAESEQKSRNLDTGKAELRKAHQHRDTLAQELAVKTNEIERACEAEQRLLAELEMTRLQLLNLRGIDVQLRIQIKGLLDLNSSLISQRETREWELAGFTQNMTARHKSLKNTVIELEAGLTIANQEAEKLKSAYGQIQNTLSWKVTRPLRYLRRLSDRVSSKTRALPKDANDIPSRSSISNVVIDYERSSDTGDKSSEIPKKGVLLVVHELSRTGAPRAVLYMAKAIYNLSGVRPTIISPVDGLIKTEFEKEGFEVIIDQAIFLKPTDNSFLSEFIGTFDRIVVTSLVSFPFVRYFSSFSRKLSWWVHEEQAGFEYIFTAVAPDLTDLFDKCDAIWLGSPLCKAPARRFGGDEKLHILLYGCDDVQMKPIKFENKQIVFTLAGSIEPRKGQDIFLDAIEKLNPSTRSKAQFRIVGSTTSDWAADYLKVMLQRIENIPEVQYISNVPLQKLNELYLESNIIVSASRADPMPIAVTQGLMFSKVCLCSSVIGHAKLLNDSENAVLFESESADQLASKIEFLIDNPNLHADIGKAARQVFEANFSMSAFMYNIDRLTDISQIKLKVENES